MNRQVLASEVEPGDVIAWAGRKSIVRGVEHLRSGHRTVVSLNLDVPELAHEGKGVSVQQNGLHWFASELVSLWDEPTEVESCS